MLNFFSNNKAKHNKIHDFDKHSLNKMNSKIYIKQSIVTII
jgi:hypothetical protein